MASNGVAGPGRHLRAGMVLLAMGTPGVCIQARAAVPCPWINAATVSNPLGAPSTSAYTGAAPFQPGVCTFVANTDRDARTLTVNVEIATDAHAREEALLRDCRTAPSQMAAIGNEAWLCEIAGRHGFRGVFVVGRVRNQVFSITIGSAIKKDAVSDSDTLRGIAETAAEQVSGNLF